MARRVTNRMIEDALRRSWGTRTAAARMLGISRTQLYRRIDQSPRLQEVAKEAREMLVDTAELRLVRAVQDGQAWAIALVVKTLGKERGYTERTEVDDIRAPDLSGVPTDQLRAWLDSARSNRGP